MINWFRIVITALLFLIIGVLLWAAFHYYGKTISQQSEISAATQAKEQAEFITKAQALTVNTFNTIAGATLDEQKAHAAASEERQVIIKTVLQKEPCAMALVPIAASDQLFSQYNSIRSGSGNTDPSQLNGGVSSQAGTKSPKPSTK